MPETQELVRVSLLSKRRDTINFIEAMCTGVFRLTIASDFSRLSFSNSSLVFIDAFLFCDFDLEILEFGEKCSEFSICILPPDLPPQIVNYVENSFKYVISIPISTEYFFSYCLNTMNAIANIRKDYISQKLEQQTIPDSFSGYFCGDSCIIRKIRSQILSAAYTKAPVLILGETGVGKTTAAGVIHTLSDRRKKKMITVEPSTIVGNLAESAFFGHIRGSYTSADYERHGYFEEADGSSLFFEELGVASLSVQAMLLTVLETGNYKRIGDNRERHTDVKMIFATNANIEHMIRAGRFRKDLYFRICDNLIRIPPLRAHKEDIRGMVMHYLNPDIMITDQAIERLENYSWPGNIRELHKCLHRAVLNNSSNIISAEDIDFGDIAII